MKIDEDGDQWEKIVSVFFIHLLFEYSFDQVPKEDKEIEKKN